MSNDDGFLIIVKKFLEEGTFRDLSQLPPSEKANFDRAAQVLCEREFLIDAARVWQMTNNTEKLKLLAEECLKQKKLEPALVSFNALRDKEGLERTGYAFLQIPEVHNALRAFEAADDTMMVSFLKANF
ncbi:MAG: hypothetical protein WC595_03230 [Candidatus Nanoarchaeia archaeon]